MPLVLSFTIEFSGEPRMNIRTVALLVAVPLALSACATRSNSPNVYRSGEAQAEREVRYGTIETMRAVDIQRDPTGVGTIAGAAIGGLAGSTVGGGRGATIATVVGALGGAIAGQAAEGAGSIRPGVELVIRFDNGDIRAIVQEDAGGLRAGDRVQIIGSGASLRVVRI